MVLSLGMDALTSGYSAAGMFGIWARLTTRVRRGLVLLPSSLRVSKSELAQLDNDFVESLKSSES